MSTDQENGEFTEQDIKENNKVDAIAIFAIVVIVVGLAVFYVSR